MWSLFDAQTIITMLTLLFVMCTGVIGLLLLSRRPAVGAGEWGVMLLVYVMNSLILQIRRPEWDLVWLTPVLVALGILPAALYWRGLMRWRGLPDLSHFKIFGWSLAGGITAFIGQRLGWETTTFSGISPVFTSTLVIISLATCWNVPELRMIKGILLVLSVVQLTRVGLYFSAAPRDVIVLSVLIQAMLVTASGASLYHAVSQRAVAPFIRSRAS
ncbi:hypothetical protein ACFSM5_02280 [Lacibacterium aquatile]|uniref:GGDEF domain-containing protein n=1 Tax=Lacibacterium aquatile TaxID=1168082 RepID=A0ABW5DKV5_9PROT